ncbi:MAG: hypothetical protein AB4060_14900 [Crocosphaera sp.]|uniref:hypothetical protein n=1 Tax=Crocosphaera sp. TaxID=2729996 RepID=UPI0026357A6A|nr:hypothetical protein [Crocosphaera sp.]MDJ0582734.1 hypothetical protein [Crocosphaera sp.]
MTCEQLQKSYQQQLVKAGVCQKKAEQAAKTLTVQQLQIIGEIWQDWGKVVGRLN